MAKQAFEGVKVVDFGWIGVGPAAAQYLGDHGATVVRIESNTRHCALRLLPPFKDQQVGINRSAFFAIVNSSKYGVTLNLSHPRGAEVAKRLVAWADIVVEGMTPGSMKKLGLDYEELRKVKPDIIMLSTTQQGQYGPHAAFGGHGGLMASLAGFFSLTGYPDGDPAMVYGAYTDFVNFHLGGILLMAALDYRRRTGKGQYIDLSQIEGTLQFLAPPLLDYKLSGRVLKRMGNRDPYSAPHGVYPCRGEDKWCAIAVLTDDQWQAFCEVIENPDWTQDHKFATLLGRKENEDELDKLIGEWTANFTAEEVMTLMQVAGVPAAAAKNPEELLDDAQLKHRGYFVMLEHPEIGLHAYHGAQFKLSKTPAQLRPAPCLGEHNEYVYKELLGMSTDEIADLMADGVLQ